MKAHAVIATQHMPGGLSITDLRIWENISNVTLSVGTYRPYPHNHLWLCHTLQDGHYLATFCTGVCDKR